MCIYCDYCVYHYMSTELVSLYTLDIGLKINSIIIKKYYYKPLESAREKVEFIVILNNLWNLILNQI